MIVITNLVPKSMGTPWSSNADPTLDKSTVSRSGTISDSMATSKRCSTARTPAATPML